MPLSRNNQGTPRLLKEDFKCEFSKEDADEADDDPK